MGHRMQSLLMSCSDVQRQCHVGALRSQRIGCSPHNLLCHAVVGLVGFYPAGRNGVIPVQCSAFSTASSYQIAAPKGMFCPLAIVWFKDGWVAPKNAAKVGAPVIAQGFPFWISFGLRNKWCWHCGVRVADAALGPLLLRGASDLLLTDNRPCLRLNSEKETWHGIHPI